MLQYTDVAVWPLAQYHNKLNPAMNESMPILTFKGQTYSCEPGETVLGCLLRHQQAIPHGCLAGVCQSCCLQSHRVPTERLVEAQQGLSEAQCRNGEFLACQLPADHSLEVSLSAQKPWHTATLARSEQLSDTVWRLEFDSSLRWQPGQYFSLSLNGIDTRCYSAALPASQGPLVFHIQRHPEGRLSDALCRLSAGDTLQLQGPFGDFRLREDSTPRRLLLIGSGTGLAPLLAIAGAATEDDQYDNIVLLRCARRITGLYESPELSRLINKGIHIETALWDDNDSLESTLRALAPLRGDHVYLSGSARFVQQFERRCFMHGASRGDIHKEMFLDFSQTTA